MKKIAVVLLSIVMMLSSLACALPQGMRMSASSPAAQQTEKDAAKETVGAAKSDAKADDKAEADTDAEDADEPDDGRFPAELFGMWKRISYKGLETLGLDPKVDALKMSYFSYLMVNCGQAEISARTVENYGIFDAETITVDGDEIVVPSLIELENSDIHIHYSVTDTKDAAVLTLRFSGKTNMDTRKATNVDAEVVYEKMNNERGLGVLYEAALIGEWIDSDGGAWIFTRIKKQPQVEFEFKTEDGKTFKCSDSNPVNFEYDEVEDAILASFTFEDKRNNITDAKVESFDGYTLMLTLDDETLELTRMK